MVDITAAKRELREAGAPVVTRKMLEAGVEALNPFFSGSGELWTLEFYPMARAVIEAALKHHSCGSFRSAPRARKG